MLNFSKFVVEKKKSHLHLRWPEGEDIFSKFSFLQELPENKEREKRREEKRREEKRREEKRREEKRREEKRRSRGTWAIGGPEVMSAY